MVEASGFDRTKRARPSAGRAILRPMSPWRRAIPDQLAAFPPPTSLRPLSRSRRQGRARTARVLTLMPTSGSSARRGPPGRRTSHRTPPRLWQSAVTEPCSPPGRRARRHLPRPDAEAARGRGAGRGVPAGRRCRACRPPRGKAGRPGGDRWRSARASSEDERRSTRDRAAEQSGGAVRAAKWRLFGGQPWPSNRRS